jgi:hypothetical protein
VKRLFWTGVLAIVTLAVAFVYVLWRVSDVGEPPVAVAPGQPAVAPAPPMPEPETPAAAQLDPQGPAADVVTDRDPRNDVQRPTDRRADLLQDERSAKMESAMDALNRRTALRKEELQANGEVRPSVPVQKVKR